MDRGTYIAAAAGLAQFKKVDVVSNNLANASTVGYKREMVTTEAQEFKETLASAIATDHPYAQADHERMNAVSLVSTYTDFSAGPIQSTGNPLDAALRNPNDLFAVNTPEGLQYTRAGNFAVNSEGLLVTQDGYEVQGDGGPIQISGPNPKIQSDGSILVNGEVQGILGVYRFEDTEGLERAGGNRFRPAASSAAPEQVAASVATESLELSNSSAINGVTDLMTAQRAFQMYTKVAESVDSINQVAINQIGRRN
jgi:flagellar basal-body rod protein FlgF